MRAPAPIRLACAGLVAWAALALVVGAAHASEGRPPVRVVICGSHDRVLAHWLQAVEDGILPASGLQVVHVDAHPDLAVPKQPLPEPGVQDPARLLGAVDIASFQLAAVHAGLVERVVWLRPEFASQLPDGPRDFLLGAVASGLPRVDDPSDYYVLDEGWAPREALRNPVPVRLRVALLGVAGRSPDLAARPTVLDIDLDAFATHNPAADRLRAAGLSDPDLEALRGMFAPEHLRLAEAPPQRIAQLEGLMASVEVLGSGSPVRWPGALWTLWRRGLTLRELYRLYGIVGNLSEGVSTEQLLEDGRELVGLPEHTQVSRAEIVARVRAIGDLLRTRKLQPSLVTIARSVDDGFTPRREWPLIEWTLLRELAATLGKASIRFDPGQLPAPQP
jgi:hypothetical protein